MVPMELCSQSDSGRSNLEIEARRVDHLGMVSGALDELKVIELVDRFLDGRREGQRVSMGQRAAALLLHLTSFENRTLYQTPEFLGGYAHENLLGDGAVPEAFNDDAMGRLLDEVYSYGPDKFFQTMAMSMLVGRGLGGNSLRLDSTSMFLHGAFPDSENGDPDEGIRVTFGYSKDGRQDLKQVMLALVTTGPADLPMIAKPLPGNASDKKEFRNIIEEFQKQVQPPQQPLWIHDSAGYTKQWLQAQKSDGDGFFPWLTRIPETIKKAQDLVRASYKEEEWEDVEEGYRAIEFHEIYGGLKQLWVLYHSEQAHARESKTLEKNLVKEREQIANALWHLSHKEFACEVDARLAFEKELKHARYHEVASFELHTENQHKSLGRPKSGATPHKVIYKIHGIIREKAEELAKLRESCGRFILGTNHIGAKKLLSQDPLLIPATGVEQGCASSSMHPSVSRPQLMLSTYKELQGTENAFRLVKDRTFMMNRFFLHSESRIEALLVFFALAIFVHNYMQHTIVKALDKAKVKLRGPGGAELKTNTLRRVFEIFRTVTAFRIDGSDRLYWMQKLSPQQVKVLDALSPTYRWKYGVTTKIQ